MIVNIPSDETIKRLEDHSVDMQENPDRHNWNKDVYTMEEFRGLCPMCKCLKDYHIWVPNYAYNTMHRDREKEKEFNYLLENEAKRIVKLSQNR